MNVVTRPPIHARLRGVVSAVWFSRGVQQAASDVVLPTGRAQIVVDLDRGTALLVGPRTTSAEVKVPGLSAGLALTALGLPRIAAVPADVLVDEVIDLKELWGGSDWLHRLEHTRSAEELLAVLELQTVRHLRSQVVDSRLVAAERAVRAGHEVGAVAALVGADRRWLAPEFRRTVGVAPKRYQRIVRFQAALRAVRTAGSVPLAAVAARAGYADQAHMSREFASLAGFTPRRLQGLSSTSPNHVSQVSAWAQACVRACG